MKAAVDPDNLVVEGVNDWGPLTDDKGLFDLFSGGNDDTNFVRRGTGRHDKERTILVHRVVFDG